MPLWLEPNWVDSTEENTDCTKEQVLDVLQDSLFVGQMMFNPSSEIGISGWSLEDMDKKYLELFNGSWPLGSSFRLVTYDTVWLAALGLNATLTQLIEKGKYLS